MLFCVNSKINSKINKGQKAAGFLLAVGEHLIETRPRLACMTRTVKLYDPSLGGKYSENIQKSVANKTIQKLRRYRGDLQSREGRRRRRSSSSQVLNTSDALGRGFLCLVTDGLFIALDVVGNFISHELRVAGMEAKNARGNTLRSREEYWDLNCISHVARKIQDHINQFHVSLFKVHAVKNAGGRTSHGWSRFSDFHSVFDQCCS